jgi:hypothetical protein
MLGTRIHVGEAYRVPDMYCTTTQQIGSFYAAPPPVAISPSPPAASTTMKTGAGLHSVCIPNDQSASNKPK